MKRADVPFDSRHFESKKKAGRQLTTEETFTEIFLSNHWSSQESLSGTGSAKDQTNEISLQIPILVKELEIKKFLDVPCGDFNWFSKMKMNLELYIGGDIIEEIVNRNKKQFREKNLTFRTIDLIKDSLPEADILHCRDCFVHLSHHDILEAIENIKKADIKYLLTTTFSECEENEDIVTGDWRIINMEKAPFNFPKPMKLINEKRAVREPCHP